MRRNGVLYWLRADHLGSASLVLDANGKWLADQRFYPYGETKRSDGASASYPTDRLFTGMALYASLGIYHMGARWFGARTVAERRYAGVESGKSSVSQSVVLRSW
jgi:hypothetical protein